jgi:hypothetical protein
MKTIRFILLLFSVLWNVGPAFAQKPAIDPFHDENGNTYHQLFVDFRITEIIDIKYTIDNAPVEGELSADGYSVIIKNYPGDRSVILKVKDDSGQEKEITKSRCFIDPVLLQL